MRYSVNSAQVISEIIDGEAVMINLTTGNYYSLNETGAEIWEAIERSESVDRVVAALAARYRADRDEIERAVGLMIEELEREELIVRAEATENGTPPEPDTSSAPAAPFAPPRLEKHTDMQDLILLDPVHEVGEQGWPHVEGNGQAARAPDKAAD